MTPNPDDGQGSSLTEGQREALLQLLADEDQDVYAAVRDQILTLGKDSRHWLKPYALSNDALLRRRVREIVRYYELRDADEDFLAFCLNRAGKLDLETGLWLLSKTYDPGIQVDGYSALIDEHLIRIRDDIEEGAGADAKIEAVNQCLFEQLGFSLVDEEACEPRDYYLSALMDRRKGAELNLSALCLLMLKRLRAPACVAVLDGCHFLKLEGEDSLYPIGAGVLDFLTADGVLGGTGIGVADSYSNRQLLFKICGCLMRVYSTQGDAEQRTRMLYYLAALADGIPRQRPID